MSLNQNTRTRTTPQGNVNLADLRFSISKTRSNFTRVRTAANRSASGTGPEPDFITFVSLACEIYRGQENDLVPMQQYSSILETSHGRGHTSLVSRAEVDFATPSNSSRGVIETYSEGIAIKRPRQSFFENKSQALNSFITELRVRSHPPLRFNPRIASLRGVGWDFEDRDATIPRPLLLEEFAPQGALDSFWRNWKFVKLSFTAKLEFCREIADGLRMLHGCGVVHGDVKPENILVFPSKELRNSFVLKLTDFGHSVVEADRGNSLPAFTPQWSAPEASTSTTLTFDELKATDCYSFGLVVLSVMLSRPFYDDIDNVKTCKEDGSILQKSFDLVETEDRVNHDSDVEIGTVASILESSVQISPQDRSLDRCLSIIDVYQLNNLVTTGRGQSVYVEIGKVPPLKVLDMVSVGYHTLMQCSHQLKAEIVTRLQAIAKSTSDPRKPTAEWELAICYFSGFGVLRDFGASSDWLSMAHKHGVDAAQTYFISLQEAIEVAQNCTDKNAAVATKRNNETANYSLSAAKVSLASNHAANAAVVSSTKKLDACEEDATEEIASRPDVVQSKGKTSSTSRHNKPWHQEYLKTDQNRHQSSDESSQNRMEPQLARLIEVGSLQEIGDAILKKPTCINSQDLAGNTPLILAAKSDRLDILRFLISQPGIDASIPNKSGQTVLHFLTGFDEAEVDDLVISLMEQHADLDQESLPVKSNSERFLFTQGMRCCPILNAVLHDKTVLLQSLLIAAHSKSRTSMCRICEAGSRFRRMLAVSLSLFRAEALELLMGHIHMHKEPRNIDLKKIKVWAGQELLPLYSVPFRSVAVAAMDLPENFFRAMIYGRRYTEVLQRTIKLLATTPEDGNDDAVSPNFLMLTAAVKGGSLDAVNMLLDSPHNTKLRQPLWWLGNAELRQTPLSLAIKYGTMDIFDRLLEQDTSFLTQSVSYTCSKMNCRDQSKPSWPERVNSFLLQRQRGVKHLPPGHIHEWNAAKTLMKDSATVRHQNSYFLKRIVQVATDDVLLYKAASQLFQSIKESNFKAADILIERYPRLWDQEIADRGSMNDIEMNSLTSLVERQIYFDHFISSPGHLMNTMALILLTGSYEQCQFLMRHVSFARSGSTQRRPTMHRCMLTTRRKLARNTDVEGTPDWQRCPLERSEYHALLQGNIACGRPDRQLLWSVVMVQSAEGHSCSASWLEKAIVHLNADALQEMLNHGWSTNSVLGDQLDTFLRYAVRFRDSQLLMMEESSWQEFAGRNAKQFSISNMIKMEMDRDLSSPSLGRLSLQTHEAIYQEYIDSRNLVIRELWEAKLNQVVAVLQSYRHERRPWPFVGIFVLNTPSKSSLKTASIWLYAALIFVAIPFILVYTTEDVWDTMSLGPKFGFVYLWAVVTFFFSSFWFYMNKRITTDTFFPTFYRENKWLFASLLVAYCVFNHAVLPYLIIGFGWRPFSSCEYWVEESHLASSCTNLSFLLPLAVGVCEFITVFTITRVYRVMTR